MVDNIKIVISGDGPRGDTVTVIGTVYAKITSANLTLAEVAGPHTVTNSGATEEVIMVWPELANGQEALFYVGDAYYLRVVAASGIKIRVGDVQSVETGYIRSKVVGNWLRIKAIQSELVVIGLGGIWSYDE